jgi:hypothetical protein
MERVQQGDKLSSVALTYPTRPLPVLLAGEKPLASVVRGAGVSKLYGVLLTPCSTALHGLDHKGEEKREGKDREQKIDEQSQVGEHACCKTVHTADEGLPKTLGGVTRIQCTQVMRCSIRIEQSDAKVLWVRERVGGA